MLGGANQHCAPVRWNLVTSHFFIFLLRFVDPVPAPIPWVLKEASHILESAQSMWVGLMLFDEALYHLTGGNFENSVQEWQYRWTIHWHVLIFLWHSNRLKAEYYRDIWLTDIWENAWIIVYSNCSSTFLFLLRFLYVPLVKSHSGGYRLSWQIFSCPPPHFLQACGMLASSVIISLSYTMGYRYYDSSLHYTRSFWCRL